MWKAVVRLGNGLFGSDASSEKQLHRPCKESSERCPFSDHEAAAGVQLLLESDATAGAPATSLPEEDPLPPASWLCLEVLSLLAKAPESTWQALAYEPARSAIIWAADAYDAGGPVADVAIPMAHACEAMMGTEYPQMKLLDLLAHEAGYGTILCTLLLKHLLENRCPEAEKVAKCLQWICSIRSCRVVVAQELQRLLATARQQSQDPSTADVPVELFHILFNESAARNPQKVAIWALEDTVRVFEMIAQLTSPYCVRYHRLILTAAKWLLHRHEQRRSTTARLESYPALLWAGDGQDDWARYERVLDAACLIFRGLAAMPAHMVRSLLSVDSLLTIMDAIFFCQCHVRSLRLDPLEPAIVLDKVSAAFNVVSDTLPQRGAPDNARLLLRSAGNIAIAVLRQPITLSRPSVETLRTAVTDLWRNSERSALSEDANRVYHSISQAIPAAEQR